MRASRASVAVPLLALVVLMGGSMDGSGTTVAQARERGAEEPVRSTGFGPSAREVRRAHRDHGLAKRRRGPCAGMYLVRTPPGGPTLCTHGLEPVPSGVDGSRRRSIQELRKALPRRARRLAAQGPHGIPCVGDGSDGYRVQAIYARRAGDTDRFANVAPLIRAYVPLMDADIAASAAQTGGERHLRWVTDADCSLRIESVVLPDDDADWAAALESKGYDSARRKYHVWVDTPYEFYCGYGTNFSDDRPGADNPHESQVGYAFTWLTCWFGDGSEPTMSTEIHEIWHTLGAVRASAPNGTEAGHCTDEFDVMCYDDGGGPMREVCPESEEPLLDCGDDDYFDTSPPAGSYLRMHLNTADSRYLVGSLTEPPPTPRDVAVTAAGPDLRVRWADVPGEEGYRIDCRSSGGFDPCATGMPGGVTTRLVDGLAPSTAYDVRVCAIGAGGTACSDPVSARTLPPVTTIDERSAGFKRTGGGWKSQRTGYGGRSYWRRANTSVRGSGTWRASVPAGTYEVHVFVPKKHVETWSARYVVFASTGKVTRKVAQEIVKGHWVSLGKFRFGGTAKVKLGDRTGEGFTWDIAYDAVRFVPISLASSSRRDGRAARP